jgi:hypothetical protein
MSATPANKIRTEVSMHNHLELYLIKALNAEYVDVLEGPNLCKTSEGKNLVSMTFLCASVRRKTPLICVRKSSAKVTTWLWVVWNERTPPKQLMIIQCLSA